MAESFLVSPIDEKRSLEIVAIIVVDIHIDCLYVLVDYLWLSCSLCNVHYSSKNAR